MQRVVGSAQFLLVEHPRHGIEAGAAHLDRHVRAVKPGVDGLGFELAVQVVAQHPALLHLFLVRIEFVPHELTGRLDDELLFVAQGKVHRYTPLRCRH